MEKRWFASLWLVVVAGASLAIQAEEEPLDLKFPLLPVRHLQWEKELPKPIGVGDRIPAVLMLSENSDPPGAEVEVATPSGHTTLLKEGVSLAETDTSVPGTIRFIVVPLRPGPITVPEMGLRKKGEKTFFARTEPLSLGAVDPLKDQEKPKEYFEAVSLGFPRWL
ncbi:MAG TPA: hypothetical protein VL588_08790, partial [Bdellovibrionota bacterium]|nr:hypothetical protein [Bdellovibrionota bacterium]